jgi:hypothetical protein
MGRTTKDLDFAGLRCEAAHNHVEAMKATEKITGLVVANRFTAAYHDFLSGWDEAMEIRYAELLEENHRLHNLLFDHDVCGPVTLAELSALRELVATAQCALEAGDLGPFEAEMLRNSLESVEQAKGAAA